MSRTECDRERVARLDGALEARCDLAWTLFVLAGASAVAARFEPPLEAFWDCAALIAACASALVAAAPPAARGPSASRPASCGCMRRACARSPPGCARAMRPLRRWPVSTGS
jgi:hypothetical protein